MSDRADDPIGIALRVAAAIESAGGSYFVGGSVASSLHGDPRSTKDIDLVVSLPLGRVEAFVAAPGSDFELDGDMLRDALRQARRANGFYLPVLTKIDLFGLGDAPFDEVEFARRACGYSGRYFSVRKRDSLKGLSSLTLGRLKEGTMPRCWRVASIVEPFVGSPLSEWSTSSACGEQIARTFRSGSLAFRAEAAGMARDRRNLSGTGEADANSARWLGAVVGTVPAKRAACPGLPRRTFPAGRRKRCCTAL